MKSAKAVFKNGVFVPLEKVDIDEGEEVIVIFNEKREGLDQLKIGSNEKQAIKELFLRLKSKIIFKELRVCQTGTGIEIFIIVEENEAESVRKVMEEAFNIYKELKVHLPIQVISTARLKKWKEQGNEIYENIKNGINVV